MNHIMEKPWINASDVGAAKYCHYSLWLNKNRYTSKQTKEIMSQGNRAHKEKNEAMTHAYKNSEGDSRCYIATHLYGPNHYYTDLLRDWRDRSLMSTLRGRALVSLYYKISPGLIKYLPRDSRCAKYARQAIEKVALYSNQKKRKTRS